MESDNILINKIKRKPPKTFCLEYWSQEICGGEIQFCSQIFGKCCRLNLFLEKSHTQKNINMHVKGSGKFCSKEICSFFLYLAILLWDPEEDAETRTGVQVVDLGREGKHGKDVGKKTEKGRQV